MRDIEVHAECEKAESKILIKSSKLHLHWLYVFVMSRTCFGVNPHSIVAWMSRNSLLEVGAKSEV